MNVLLTGNCPDTNDLLKMLLVEYEDCQVEVAIDQYDLHRRLIIDKPNVLITSYYIGTSNIKYLLSKLTLPATTILITGKFIEDVNSEFPGVSHYLLKPFNSDFLVNTLGLKRKVRLKVELKSTV